MPWRQSRGCIWKVKSSWATISLASSQHTMLCIKHFTWDLWLIETWIMLRSRIKREELHWLGSVQAAWPGLLQWGSANLIKSDTWWEREEGDNQGWQVSMLRYVKAEVWGHGGLTRCYCMATWLLWLFSFQISVSSSVQWNVSYEVLIRLWGVNPAWILHWCTLNSKGNGREKASGQPSHTPQCVFFPCLAPEPSPTPLRVP